MLMFLLASASASEVPLCGTSSPSILPTHTAHTQHNTQHNTCTAHRGTRVSPPTYHSPFPLFQATPHLLPVRVPRLGRVAASRAGGPGVYSVSRSARSDGDTVLNSTFSCSMRLCRVWWRLAITSFFSRYWLQMGQSRYTQTERERERIVSIQGGKPPPVQPRHLKSCRSTLRAYLSVLVLTPVWPLKNI